MQPQGDVFAWCLQWDSFNRSNEVSGESRKHPRAFACVFRGSVNGARPSGASALLIYTSIMGSHPLANYHCILSTTVHLHHTHSWLHQDCSTAENSHYWKLNCSLFPCEKRQHQAINAMWWGFRVFFRGQSKWNCIYVLNHTVDLTTDIIYSLTGELTHGESEWLVQSTMEEQLVFHSNLWIKIIQKQGTVPESLSRSVRKKHQTKVIVKKVIVV